MSINWDRMWDIFHEAVDLPEDERAVFLDEACKDNAELKDEVQALLASHERDGELPDPHAFAADLEIDEELATASAGQQIGAYRIVREIGQGGMGAVYEAEQEALGRRVALKMLGQQLDSPEMRKRFLREGRLAAGVNHPNSLYIFGSEEIEELPVITMEIAGAGTLKDKLKENGPMAVTEAVDAILDVISGLEAAFASGVRPRFTRSNSAEVRARRAMPQ